MSISTDRLEAIADDLRGSGLWFGHHGGHYRIGTVDDDSWYTEDPGYLPLADFHAISTTGPGFQTSQLREAEAFAAGVATGQEIAR